VAKRIPVPPGSAPSTRRPDVAHNQPPMDTHAELVRFYDDAYAQQDPADAMRYARWRALGAIGKAEHVLALCKRIGLSPTSTLEIGCGDGALLSEPAAI
jgi:hypothetical protein